MDARYLLDASALYPLVLKLREEFIHHAGKFAILDLTIYEVGNALWKEHKLGRVRNLAIAAKLFEEILACVSILRLGPRLQEILSLAASENLTFYDASYLYAARAYKMKLVTEDRDLLKYPEAINTEMLMRELREGQA